MRLFLILAALLATLATRAQNDTVTFFAFTDNNNNCLYEPVAGEVPLIGYCFKFEYVDVISGTQASFNLTDAAGRVKMPVTAPAAMASNTLSTHADVGTFSSCYSGHTNYAYNATYTVPVYNPGGFKNAYIPGMSSLDIQPNGGTIAPMPGAISYCIGKTNITPVIYGYNHIDNGPVATPLDLSVAGGSFDTQLYMTYFYYNVFGTCAYNSSGNPAITTMGVTFNNPELRTVGIYTVTFSGAASGNYIFVVDSCSSQTGNVFVDCNANCVKDATEYASSDEIITSGNGTYSTTVIPDYNGNYNIQSPYSAAQYTLTITPSTDFALACGTPSVLTYNSNTYTGPLNLSNKLNQTGVNNINYSSAVNHPYSGSSVPGGSFRFTAFYGVAHPDYCSAVNNSGSFYVKLDPNVQFVSVDASTPAYSAIYSLASGDSLVWSIADLRQRAINLTGAKFGLNLFMRTTAVIGSSYCLTAGVVSQVAETNAADNRSTGCWIIGGPFDPNYKEVFPKGLGAAGNVPPTTTELAYTIHFQNVGNAPAIDVRIKDLLDSDLDKASLRVTGSSHPVQTNVDKDGLVTFLFDNIILPDSTHDEPNSHGFVSYNIKLKPNPAIGTQIKNMASIYFDYNAPVITNTVTNTIWLQGSATGLDEAGASQLALFPNPAQHTVTLQSEGMIGELRILNVLGEQLRSMRVNARTASLDISDLAPDIYFLEIHSADQRQTIRKLIKD